MKIDNLYEGQTIKNYAALCGILEVKEQTGNSKKAQLKELERFCEYSKRGHSFRIETIYDVPLDKQDGRAGGNRSIYLPSIEFILCDLLSKQAGSLLYTSKFNLAKKVGLINADYKNVDNESILKKLDLHSWQLRDFYFETSSKFYSIINSALKSLSDRKVITFSSVHFVVDQDDHKRIANDEDEAIILEAENLALEALNFKNMQSVFLHSKIEDFQKIAMIHIRNETNWKEYYNSLKVILKVIFLKDRCRRTAQEIRQEMEHTNNKFYQYILEKAEGKLQKNAEEIASYQLKPFSNEKAPFDYAKTYRTPYIEGYEKLADNFIALANAVNES